MRLFHLFSTVNSFHFAMVLAFSQKESELDGNVTLLLVKSVGRKSLKINLLSSI